MAVGSGYRWDCGTSGAADTAIAAINTALGFPRQPTTPGPLYGGTALSAATKQSGQYLGELIGVARPSGSTRVPWLTTTIQPDRLIDGDQSPCDIIIVGGQSNAVGTSEVLGDLSADVSTALQWKQGTYADAISGEILKTKIPAANDPLDHYPTDSGSRIGFPVAFARSYITGTLASGRKLMIVPCASAGTGLVSGGAVWSIGGSLYTLMVARALAAVAQFPGSTIVGLLWHQGQDDGAASVASATYQAAQDAMFAAFRTAVGVSNLPIIVGGMPSDNRTGGTRAAIHAVIVDTPNRVSNLACVTTDGRATHDGVHYTAAAYRLIGADYYTAYTTLTP